MEGQIDFLRAKEKEKGVPHLGVFGNFALGDERCSPRDVFGENYPRLQQLKDRYDPRNVFCKSTPFTTATST
jgi:FAD/FMN-containing dehydrogenase